MCAAVLLFIQARRHESLNLHLILQGFSLSDCDWLLPVGNRAQMQRSNSQEDKKRRELLHEFIYWYFECFLIHLLRVRRLMF